MLVRRFLLYGECQSTHEPDDASPRGMNRESHGRTKQPEVIVSTLDAFHATDASSEARLAP